jgi:hypothetical protein
MKLTFFPEFTPWVTIYLSCRIICLINGQVAAALKNIHPHGFVLVRQMSNIILVLACPWSTSRCLPHRDIAQWVDLHSLMSSVVQVFLVVPFICGWHILPHTPTPSLRPPICASRLCERISYDLAMITHCELPNIREGLPWHSLPPRDKLLTLRFIIHTYI